MRAADYGHDKTVEVLAEAGAGMGLKDKEGQGKTELVEAYIPLARPSR